MQSENDRKTKIPDWLAKQDDIYLKQVDDSCMFEKNYFLKDWKSNIENKVTSFFDMEDAKKRRLGKKLKRKLKRKFKRRILRRQKPTH